MQIAIVISGFLFLCIFSSCAATNDVPEFSNGGAAVYEGGERVFSRVLDSAELRNIRQMLLSSKVSEYPAESASWPNRVFFRLGDKDYRSIDPHRIWTSHPNGGLKVVYERDIEFPFYSWDPESKELSISDD